MHAIHPDVNEFAPRQVTLAKGRVLFLPASGEPLDLMARLAGLELQNRYGGWKNEPFSSSSARHVSVYARAT